MKLQRNSVKKPNISIYAFLLTVSVVALMHPISIANADVSDEEWGYTASHEGEADWEQPFDRSFVKQWETNPPRGFPTLSRKNIAEMKNAIKRYAQIVAKGGWSKLNVTKKMGPGMNHKSVSALRRRLVMTGDLRQTGGFASTYDYYVEKAVKKFQARHGLTPTGIVDKTTVLALNVPASARLRQLRTNLVRMSTLSSAAAKKYVMVNIPAAQIEAVENDTVVSRHAAVVGKIDRQTPILRSNIHAINFNPYWTVPMSIVRKDLVPQARQYSQRGKPFLKAYRMSVFDGNGRELSEKQINWFSDAVYNYRYRQDPWKENSMGFVKINFHNAHAVYMHDTPSKSLFGRNFRAHSSGCVRVQNVQKLVAWLLKGTSNWNADRISNVKRTGEREDVNLASRVPVYFVYVTAWANEDGTVQFRRDLYKRDNVGATASAY